MLSGDVDWIDQLLAQDVDLDCLQLDPTLLPDEQASGRSCDSAVTGHAAGCTCCSSSGSQLSDGSLPALEALLNDPGAEDWLDSLDLGDLPPFPASGTDPLDGVLARLEQTPEEFFGPAVAVTPNGQQPLPQIPEEASSPGGVKQAAAAAVPARRSSESADSTADATSLQGASGFIVNAAMTAGAAAATAAADARTSQKRAHSDDLDAQSRDRASSQNSAQAAERGSRENSPAFESRFTAAADGGTGSRGPHSPTASDSESSGISAAVLAEAAKAAAAFASAAGSPSADGSSSCSNRRSAAQAHAQPATNRNAAGVSAAVQLQAQSCMQQAAAAGAASAAAGAAPGRTARSAHPVQHSLESAQAARQRKAAEDTERRCQELQSHNTQLAGLVSRLTAENACLRQQLLTVCAQTGQQPPPLQPGFVPPPMSGVPFAPGVPAKIPIQKLKPMRPAPAPRPAAKGMLPTTAGAAATQPARKKIKTAAGAGTALLAVFACVVICGPYAPAPSTPVSFGGGQPAGQVQPYVPPAGRAAMAGGRGRVLSALPAVDTNESSHAAAVEVVKGMLDSLSDWEGGGDSSSNASAVALQQNDPVLESLALQRLKELAPLALFGSGPEQRLPGGRTFASIAQAVLNAEGLSSPVGCQEVFRFDAGGLMDGADISAARVNQYVDSLTTSQRSLPLTLPSHSSVPEDTDSSSESSSESSSGGGPAAGSPAAAGGGSKRRQAGSSKRQRGPQRIAPDPDDVLGGSGFGGGASQVVSMLLPTKSRASQPGGNLTALDQMYVVVLEPSQTYATYSCRLPSPVLF